MPKKYTGLAMFFHWAVALGIIYNILLHPEMEDLPIEMAADALNIHTGVGLSLLILMIGRIWWRIKNPTPPLPDTMKPWEKVLAHAVQYGLYGLICLMLIMGLLSAAFASYAPAAFGIIPLDWFAPGNEGLQDFFASTHHRIAPVIAGLVVLHTLAAIYHALAKRDGVMRSMLPW